MDFGIGFLSNNVMLPILDFFYGLVPSYGLAIVALTLVIRVGLYPLSAGSIRSARRMKIANPVLQKRQQEIRERYQNDPTKQQEELGKLFKEFGNPLSGCLPLVFQMPILFALFATLRGSPFADVAYSVNVQVIPESQIEQVQPRAYVSPTKNIYVTDGVHVPLSAVLPAGARLGVGEKTEILFETETGETLDSLEQQYATPDTRFKPTWTVTKGEEFVEVNEQGQLIALQPGDATIEGKIPGLAANRGFLFIQALGRVGAVNGDGSFNWDIIAMVLFFGGSLYVNQLLSGQGASQGNPQQETVNKITPVLFSGMFLFFPLPAGVLMYMVIANIFQTTQTFILMREPLPENLQAIVDADAKQKKKEEAATTVVSPGGGRLPFEPTKTKKKKA